MYVLDYDLWEDAQAFRPERWLEKPDAPLFTFGLGYRMCAGHLLAAREVYLVFMRLLASFEIKPHDNADLNPKTGFKNPKDLIITPHPYTVRFVPRNEAKLKAVLADEEKKEDLVADVNTGA